MQLTRALFYYIRRRHIPGKLDIGKHQLVKPVTPSMKAAALKELLQQKENMELLQRPYLTAEEERGHVVACGRLAAMNASRNDERISTNMFKNYTMEEHLNHLIVTKKWE